MIRPDFAPLLLRVSPPAPRGCDKPWTEREMVARRVKLTDGSSAAAQLPKAMTADTAGMFEAEKGRAVRTSSGVVDMSGDNFMKTRSGSAFETKDLPGGYGVAFESGGPHVHAVRTDGTRAISGDASFSASTSHVGARRGLIRKICSSIDWAK